MAHVNIKSLPLSLVLAGSVLLVACSSKPSPWAESSSPWDSRPQQVEAEVVEPVAMEEPAPAEFVDMTAVEATPLGDESMYANDPMPGDAMAVEPVVVEEIAPMAAIGDLSSQPADYFVVQVVASSTMAQLNDFANANNMSSDWVAETNVNGKTWYVLILGVYPTKAEADQALASVSNMNTQPWVRSVGSLQSVMQ